MSLTEFDLAAAEARIFEAQSRLEEQAVPEADELAYGAMLLGARGLIKSEFIDIGDDPDAIVPRVPHAFFDTQLFLRQVPRRQVRDVPLPAARVGPRRAPDAVHHLIEEAQLFLEACHACQARLAARPAAGMPAATEGRAR